MSMPTGPDYPRMSSRRLNRSDELRSIATDIAYLDFELDPYGMEEVLAEEYGDYMDFDSNDEVTAWSNVLLNRMLEPGGVANMISTIGDEILSETEDYDPDIVERYEDVLARLQAIMARTGSANRKGRRYARNAKRRPFGRSRTSASAMSTSSMEVAR